MIPACFLTPMMSAAKSQLATLFHEWKGKGGKAPCILLRYALHVRGFYSACRPAGSIAGVETGWAKIDVKCEIAVMYDLFKHLQTTVRLNYPMEYIILETTHGTLLKFLLFPEENIGLYIWYSEKNNFVTDHLVFYLSFVRLPYYKKMQVSP